MSSNPPAEVGKKGQSIARQLLIRVGAIVAVVAILLGVVSTAATAQILLANVDNQLNAAQVRQTKGPMDDPDRDGAPPGLLQPGMPIGTVILLGTTSQLMGGELIEGGYKSLTTDTVSALLEQSHTDRPVSINLPDLGRYRVSAQSGNGYFTVTGLPLLTVDQTIARLAALSAVLCLVAVGLAVLIVRIVLQRSLQPLSRLAATARSVSQQDLARQQLSDQFTVNPQDADERTEVGQVGNAFNRMIDNVRGALAARRRSELKMRQFVADASHELRNPLAAIRGYAELSQRMSPELPDQLRQSLARIDSESLRMSALVEDLLLLARLDIRQINSQGQAIELRQIDLSQLAIDVIADAQAAGPDHRWSLDLPSAPVFLSADQSRLHQVLLNILTNARVHTPAGTMVHTAVSVRPDQVQIDISDNGPGIPEEIRDHVFERFSRADSARTRTGSSQSTGLGMAIVAAVIDAHGGTVEAFASDQGTTIRIILPVQGSEKPVNMAS